MMKRGANIIDSFLIDLLIEILSRLPEKSVARFRCVSKQWGSMLCSPYFTELFLTRSSARRRLLFAVKQGGEWFFLSIPQNPYEKSSFVVDFHSHIKFSGETSQNICSYDSGMLYFPSMQISTEEKVRVVCNPITGEYGILPNVKYKQRISFLGFDPIDKHFKVLAMNNSIHHRGHCYILTIGTPEVWWRKIKCPFTYRRLFGGICINGVLYYVGFDSAKELHVIVCFDVRSEKFKVLNRNPNCYFDWSPSTTTLINYKGKLGVVDWKYGDSGGFPLELCIWVLMDVEEQEWWDYVYTLWVENEVAKVENNLIVAGMTATGEIILSMAHTCIPFYVFYFSPERYTLQTVELKGFGEYLEAREISGRVFAFVDHVEELLT